MDEIDEIILNELAKGSKQTKIAKRIGLSRVAIYYRINKMREKGIEIPEEPLDDINKLILQELADGKI